MAIGLSHSSSLHVGEDRDWCKQVIIFWKTPVLERFKTIIVFKDTQVLKSKRVYVFLFFECFEHMDPFLWNILKFTKKWKQFGEHFDKGKGLLIFKNHLSTCFS
jgi:hypothetical protein